MERTKKAWITGIILLVTLAVNGLGAAGLIGGLSQKDISDRYLTLITPSPRTFSIWSIIYTLLILSVIMMIVRKNDPYYQKAIDRITTLFWISSILNIVWIVLFSLLFVEVSALFIFAFLIVLVLIDKRLLEIREGRRWLLPTTFGMYSGWLLIATVVNIAAALVKQQWNGFGISPEIWASLILIVAIGILLVVLRSIRNAIFPLPVAWAYLGINEFLRSPLGFKGQYGLLQVVTLIGMAVLIGIAAIQFYVNRFSVLPAASAYAPAEPMNGPGSVKKPDSAKGRR